MSGEPDVERLREDLDQIKEAMGIAEQYEGAASVWLLFGLAVPLAAALSQYVHLEELPAWYHTFIWLGVLASAYGFYALLADAEFRVSSGRSGKPNLWLQFGIVYLAAIPLQAIASAYAGDLGYAADSMLSLSIILVVLGVAYGIFGSSLRAYRVRKRDRRIFYVGTVWMVALAVAIPRIPFLERWGYAAMGALYFVYAMGAYVVIERT